MFSYPLFQLHQTQARLFESGCWSSLETGSDFRLGTNSCSWTKGPAATVIPEVVLEVLDVSLTSLAVTVMLPAVNGVTLKVVAPPARTALGARLALVSEEVRPTTSLIVPIGFQFASTALIVTLKTVPAV